MIRVAHTSELEPELLDALHALLVEVFEGNFEDARLGARARRDARARLRRRRPLVGHASVVQRRLIHSGRALRTGYVEGVGVRADARRRGHASGADGRDRARDPRRLRARRARRERHGDAVLPRPRLAAVGGRDLRADAEGIERTPEDDDSLHVLELAAPLDRRGAIACDWRDGAPGRREFTRRSPERAPGRTTCAAP